MGGTHSAGPVRRVAALLDLIGDIDALGVSNGGGRVRNIHRNGEETIADGEGRLTAHINIERTVQCADQIEIDQFGELLQLIECLGFETRILEFADIGSYFEVVLLNLPADLVDGLGRRPELVLTIKLRRGQRGTGGAEILRQVAGAFEHRFARGGVVGIDTQRREGLKQAIDGPAESGIRGDVEDRLQAFEIGGLLREPAVAVSLLLHGCLEKLLSSRNELPASTPPTNPRPISKRFAWRSSFCLTKPGVLALVTLLPLTSMANCVARIDSATVASEFRRFPKRAPF